MITESTADDRLLLDAKRVGRILVIWERRDKLHFDVLVGIFLDLFIHSSHNKW